MYHGNFPDHQIPEECYFCEVATNVLKSLPGNALESLKSVQPLTTFHPLHENDRLGTADRQGKNVSDSLPEAGTEGPAFNKRFICIELYAPCLFSSLLADLSDKL